MLCCVARKLSNFWLASEVVSTIMTVKVSPRLCAVLWPKVAGASNLPFWSRSTGPGCGQYWGALPGLTTIQMLIAAGRPTRRPVTDCVWETSLPLARSVNTAAVFGEGGVRAGDVEVAAGLDDACCDGPADGEPLQPVSRIPPSNTIMRRKILVGIVPPFRAPEAREQLCERDEGGDEAQCGRERVEGELAACGE